MQIKLTQTLVFLLAMSFLTNCGQKEWIDTDPYEISCSSRNGTFSLVNKYQFNKEPIIVEIDKVEFRVFPSENNVPVTFDISNIDGIVFERLDGKSYLLSVNDENKIVGLAKLNENCAKMIETILPANISISKI